MVEKEAREWLIKEGYVRCKEKSSHLLFDAMPWDDDAVILRQASPTPVSLYIISMDVFVEKFAPLGD